MDNKDYWLPSGYQALRALSRSSNVLLCRESASDRLLVVKIQRIESSFQREARALAQVAGFAAAPALFFASPAVSPQGTAYWLGIEYRPGKPLVEFVGKLDRTELRRLAAKLQFTLRALHDDWQMAHGDLSPRNILLGEDGRLSFLDWEFAQNRRQHAIGSYAQYRGTIGFTETEKETDPFAGDWQAMEACLRFLREDGTGSASRASLLRSPKLPWNWLQRT